MLHLSTAVALSARHRPVTSAEDDGLASLQVTTSGFSTFAGIPVASPAIAEAKLRAIVQAAEFLRGR